MNNEQSKLYSIEYMEKRVNHKGYKMMECSSVDQNGLNAVFTEAMSLILTKYEKKKEPKESFCNLI